MAYLSRYEKAKYGFECAFILLACFLAIRYDWGNDYKGYLFGFHEINSYNLNLLDWSTLKAYSRNGELGWAFLNVLFKPFGFFSMIIALTVFEQYVLYRFIKKHVSREWYWLALFLYIFSSHYMLIGASMMRQYLVMTLYLIAIEYIYNKKLLYFIAIILLGFTVHSSALILLPTYFLRYIIDVKINKSVFLVLVLLYIIWSFSAPYFFSDIFSRVLNLEVFKEYNRYVPDKLTESYIQKSARLGIIFNYLLVITYLYKLSVQSTKIKFLFILGFIGILIYPLQAIAPLFGRIGYYFGLLTIVCYPNLIKSVKKKLYRNLLLVGLVLVNIKGFFTFFYSQLWYEHFYLYKTIFEASYWM